MRDHGGNLEAAQALYGGESWLDLSTGINRRPWPMPALPQPIMTRLPSAAAHAALVATAQAAYGSKADILPLAGAQGAIQLIPRLSQPGLARVLGPTYNEHAAALRNAGWTVEEVTTVDALPGANLAIIVNPNNPDGKITSRETLLDMASKVGRLVVDESFADPVPQISIAAQAGQAGIIVLRSFGKFYGLAGLRLGFALGPEAIIQQLSELAGPWAVSGPALYLGQLALADASWAQATTAQLAKDAERLDRLAIAAGWGIAGGAHLFRLYETISAKAAQADLARHQVWSRIFPWSDRLIRLGLPGPEPEWAQTKRAFAALSTGQSQQG